MNEYALPSIAVPAMLPYKVSGKKAERIGEKGKEVREC